MRHPILAGAALVLELWLISGTSGSARTASRPFSVHVMVQASGIGDAFFGRRARHIFVEQLAPYDTLGDFALSRQWGWDRSRLLEITAHSAHIERLQTDPKEGVWLRTLAPDGRRLAVGWLNGNIARAGIYDLNTGRFRRLPYRISNEACAFKCPLWISNHEYVDYEPSAAVEAEQMSSVEYAHGLIDRWDREAWSGQKSVPLVYRSGMTQRHTAAPGGELVLVDPDTGQTRDLGAGSWQSLVLSPSRDHLAAVRQSGHVTMGASAMGAVFGADQVFRLLVYDFTHRARAIEPCRHCNITPGSLRWSPDGEKLFFDTRINVHGKWRHSQYIFDFRTQRLKRFNADGLPFKISENPLLFRYIVPFVWLNDTTPAIRIQRQLRAPASASTSPKHAHQRGFSWYALPPGGHPVNLTAALPDAGNPESLSDFVAVYRNSMLVMAGGNLWRVKVDGQRQSLTRKIPERLVPWCYELSYWRNFNAPGACGEVERFSWVRPVDAAALAHGWVTFRMIASATTNSLLFLNIRTGEVSTVTAPSPSASLLAASALAHGALYWVRGASGDSLQWAPANHAAIRLLRFNEQLRGIVPGRPILLARRGANRDAERDDWLLLPPTYRPGDREPLLVDFYPGLTYSRQWTGDSLRTVDFLNPWLAAAHGFAVLLPSMPLSRSARSGNPCSDMYPQLRGAVENAIGRGYVDPARMALVGHSYGAYGVYCVIAHTHRFKAAIAIDGPSNLTSAYASGFPGPADDDSNLAYGTLWAESGQGEMVSPPWVDPMRYVRNSPLFLANRIRTPILILHGNDDSAVSVTESEQMFNALHRLGRTAELVRYWGESHGYRSPVDMADMWRRIFVWLDTYLNIRSATPPKRVTH
jgi:dipeptidyl aminopeptidase/acylaminoacyl peptidase